MNDDDLKLGFVLEVEDSNSFSDFYQESELMDETSDPSWNPEHSAKKSVKKRKAQDDSPVVPKKEHRVLNWKKAQDDSPVVSKKEERVLNWKKAQNDSSVVYKKEGSVLDGMKSADLLPILKGDVLPFCQGVGLLAKSAKCSCCNQDMRLETTYESLKQNYRFICRKKGQNKVLSYRKGTWFEGSKLSFSDVLWLTYMWLYRYSYTLMAHETDFTPKVIINYNKKCLEVCQSILEMKNEPLGGEEKVVEIYNCKFKEEGAQNWGFCALEQKSTKALYVLVEDKTSKSITQMLSKYILPGSTLIGSFWSAYKNLSEKDFKYLTKEKQIAFYNCTTNSKMDTYKEFVTVAHKHQPLTHLYKNEHNAQFFEKMYRKSLSKAPDAYIQFLKDIAMVYKPVDVYVKSEVKTNGNKKPPQNV